MTTPGSPGERVVIDSTQGAHSALRFGVFIPPVHDPRLHPTRVLRRDIELIAEVDALGFDEVWVGEHHSGGHEYIAAPELVIAQAAAYAPRIRLGTGVISLPFHHPFQVADRIVLLDHLTNGRVMLGCGPGALPSDAYMMGIDAGSQRGMMEDALEAIIALLDGSEPVTRRTEWFALREARLQLRPATPEGIEIAVTAQQSASGPRLAGRFGTGMLSMGATTAAGVELLRRHWEIAEERAAEYDQTVDRGRWRLVGPMHLADSMEKAKVEVEYGLSSWVAYFQEVATLPSAGELGADGELVTGLNRNGLAVIGTPDMAIGQVTRLLKQSGGFGCYLLVAHDWANWEATIRSLRLFAEEVIPHFRGHKGTLLASRTWASGRRLQTLGERPDAVDSVI